MPGMGLINTRLSSYKEEDLSCGTWTVRTTFKAGALISLLHFKRFWGKPRTRWQDLVQRDTSHPRSKKMEETNRRQRRMEASSEGRQTQKGL